MAKNPVPLTAWLAASAEKAESPLAIFQADPPAFTPEMLPRLAEMFKMKAAVRSEPKDAIHLTRQGEQVLAFYERSGAFTYSDLSKHNNASYQPKLPSLEEAPAIARKFLEAHDLLPQNVVEDSVQMVSLEQITQKGKERTKKTLPNHISVNFHLKVGNLVTYGPGARIQVSLGEGGEVIGLVHAVRTYHRIAEMDLRRRAEIGEILVSKLGQSLEKIQLQDQKLVYYAESFVQAGAYLQPVYILNLTVPIQTNHQKEPVPVNFMTHPIPATHFGPDITIASRGKSLRAYRNEPFRLDCRVKGGTPPYRVSWTSNVDGPLSEQPTLETRELSIAHRGNKITSHTIQAEVTDANGMRDSHQVNLRVLPRRGSSLQSANPKPDDEIDPFVGVEWCNLYHGSAPDISGTNPSAQGFKNGLLAIGGWSSRFDWGNDAAWEEDFKYLTAPGGGTDTLWADNVHFAFFAGHGSPGAFYFGSTVDDHQLQASDARWGEGLLNWIVLHACNTMMNNFNWTVWCDSFRGLHQMFGFHTTTEGSDPPLGSRFAFWLSWSLFGITFDMRTAWRMACSECFDSSVEYAMIYANQTGTDTQNDHLPGFGHVSADPTVPNVWCYTKAAC